MGLNYSAKLQILKSYSVNLMLSFNKTLRRLNVHKIQDIICNSID